MNIIVTRRAEGRAQAAGTVRAPLGVAAFGFTRKDTHMADISIGATGATVSPTFAQFIGDAGAGGPVAGSPPAVPAIVGDTFEFGGPAPAGTLAPSAPDFMASVDGETAAIAGEQAGLVDFLLDELDGAWAEVKRLQDEAASVDAAPASGVPGEVLTTVVEGIDELKDALVSLTQRVDDGLMLDVEYPQQISEAIRSSAADIVRTMVPLAEGVAAGPHAGSSVGEDVQGELETAGQDLAHATELQRIMADPNLAWEDKILLFLFLIVKRAQKNVEEQGKRIAMMQDGHGGEGDSIQLEMKKLERMMQALGELFETLSSVLKDCHERIFKIAKNMTLNG